MLLDTARSPLCVLMLLYRIRDRMSRDCRVNFGHLSFLLSVFAIDMCVLLCYNVAEAEVVL